MFTILLHVIMKMENTWQVFWMIQRLYLIKLQNHTKKKQKLFQQIFMKKSNL